MHASSIIFATAAFFLSAAQASPVALSERQIVYGCYFYGDGISGQYVSVGHDIDVRGSSGATRLLDCGTTSTQYVPGVFAKCDVDGVQATMTAIAGDSVNIKCSF